MPAVPIGSYHPALQHIYVIRGKHPMPPTGLDPNPPCSLVWSKCMGKEFERAPDNLATEQAVMGQP